MVPAQYIEFCAQVDVHLGVALVFELAAHEGCVGFKAARAVDVPTGGQ
jgi:hypothetical protein